MKTTSIATNESDIKVYFGDYKFYSQPRELAYTSVKYLYTDLTDIRKYYIKLGFHLEEFSRCGYYRDFGFLNLEDFCEKNLGLDKSAVSRCINVYRTFNASESPSFVNGIEVKGSSMELSEQWGEYSYSQLCEMLPLTPEQRKDILPDMSVKQIREYKKNLNKKTDNPVATSQPFNYNEYNNCVSAETRQKLIKDCDPIKEVALCLFDKDGNVVENIWCDLICTKENCYMFRLHQSRKK